MTLSDFSTLTPFAVSTLELGLSSGRDLVMDGPFQEPDEYFLKLDLDIRLCFGTRFFRETTIYETNCPMRLASTLQKLDNNL